MSALKAKYYISIFFITLMVIPAGCGKEVFRGPEVIERTELAPFTDINVNGIFDVQLSNADTFLIQLTGHKNIIQNIDYTVNGYVLELSDGNPGQWMPDYPHVRLIIGFPDLQRITINSPSKVFSKDTIHSNSFSVRAYGLLTEIDIAINTERFFLTTSYEDFGYYEIRGSTTNSEIRIYGSAQLHASDLYSEFAWIRNFSIGDCHVHVNRHLRALLGHYGNIYYYGSPEEITIDRMESRGRLIRGD